MKAAVATMRMAAPSSMKVRRPSRSIQAPTSGWQIMPVRAVEPLHHADGRLGAAELMDVERQEDEAIQAAEEEERGQHGPRERAADHGDECSVITRVGRGVSRRRSDAGRPHGSAASIPSSSWRLMETVGDVPAATRSPPSARADECAGRAVRLSFLRRSPRPTAASISVPRRASSVWPGIAARRRRRRAPWTPPPRASASRPARVCLEGRLTSSLPLATDLGRDVEPWHGARTHASPSAGATRCSRRRPPLSPPRDADADRRSPAADRRPSPGRPAVIGRLRGRRCPRHDRGRVRPAARDRPSGRVAVRRRSGVRSRGSRPGGRVACRGAPGPRASRQVRSYRAPRGGLGEHVAEERLILDHEHLQSSSIPCA